LSVLAHEMFDDSIFERVEANHGESPTNGEHLQSRL
jgi:hypothetical protein